MIKIEIQSLEGSCEIEFKQERTEFSLIAVLSKSDYLKEKGSVWHGKSEESTTINGFITLIEACRINPGISKRPVISDGLLIKIHLTTENELIKLDLMNIEKGMKEFELVNSVLQFCKKAFNDLKFDSCLQLLENYIRN